MTDFRDRDTTPAPRDPEARLAADVAELQLTLMRVGELVTKINHSITLLNLAERTIEHRVNTVQDAAEAHAAQLEDHERRLRELETAPTAAE